jgi:pimeloyl-ACP methyl ester carboxylesterase
MKDRDMTTSERRTGSASRTGSPTLTSPPATTAPWPALEDAVSSRDGTTIAYRQFGGGPGLVVLHGTASSGANHVQLAQALADAFTVYVPDRRGRGRSGPYRAGDVLQIEVEDLAALLAKTGAPNVFGVSSGGIIAFQAGLSLPIDKIAVYEPPLTLDPVASAAVLARFDAEMASGNTAAALVTAMQGAEMGPAFFRAMPRWLSERLSAMVMRQEDRKGAGAYVPMRDLARTMRVDFEIVVAKSGHAETFATLPAEVLLLGGSKSPAYLKAALLDLERQLRRAKRVELPGLDHAASWNTDRGGDPAPVARVLREFFS